MGEHVDTSKLVWVNAPHYCAGLVTRDDVCTEAAPILRWAVGKPWPYLRRYFDGKGFEVVVMADPGAPGVAA